MYQIIDHGNSGGRDSSFQESDTKISFSLPKTGTMAKCKISVFVQENTNSRLFTFKSKEDDFEIEDLLSEVLSSEKCADGSSCWFAEASNGTYDYIFSKSTSLNNAPTPQLRIKFTDSNSWGEENGVLATCSENFSSVSGQIIQLPTNNIVDTFYVYFKFDTFSYTGLDIDTQWARLKLGRNSGSSNHLILTKNIL